MEILMYQPDATELENDADAAMMQQLASAFTRRGLVKALSGFGRSDRQRSLGARVARREPETDWEGLTLADAMVTDEPLNRDWSAVSRT